MNSHKYSDDLKVMQVGVKVAVLESVAVFTIVLLIRFTLLEILLFVDLSTCTRPRPAHIGGNNNTTTFYT